MRTAITIACFLLIIYLAILVSENGLQGWLQTFWKGHESKVLNY